LRGLAAAVLVGVATLTSCSNPIDHYLDQVGDITSQMRRESIVAMPEPGNPTPDGVAGVIAARRSAVDALQNIVPPPDMLLEHTALAFSLSELVSASEAVLDANSGSNTGEFAAAMQAATELDLLAERVTAACNALAARATELGHTGDVRC